MNPIKLPFILIIIGLLYLIFFIIATGDMPPFDSFFTGAYSVAAIWLVISLFQEVDE